MSSAALRQHGPLARLARARRGTFERKPPHAVGLGSTRRRHAERVEGVAPVSLPVGMPHFSQDCFVVVAGTLCISESTSSARSADTCCGKNNAYLPSLPTGKSIRKSWRTPVRPTAALERASGSASIFYGGIPGLIGADPHGERPRRLAETVQRGARRVECVECS